MDERSHRPVPRLPKPATVTASVGYSLAEATKKGIGLVAALTGQIRSVTPFRRSAASRQGDRALLQLALLEAILCIPGHVEALGILVKNTVTLGKSSERCSAALRDAADANKRLSTWVDLMQPGIFARFILLAFEVAAFQVFLVGFVLSPSTTRSLAAYLEFTSSKAYALALQDMDENGLLAPLGARLLPWATCVLCNLQVGSTVKDALPVFCSEAEEHSAAFLTAAHTEASWFPHFTRHQDPVTPTTPDSTDGIRAHAPNKQATATSPKPVVLRPSSFGSLKRVSQLFDSKWAKTPRVTPDNSLVGTQLVSALQTQPEAARDTSTIPTAEAGDHDEGDTSPANGGNREHDIISPPLSPRGNSMAPATPPGDDADMQLPQQPLVEGEGDISTGYASPNVKEVFVDAKEVLTPAEVNTEGSNLPVTSETAHHQDAEDSSTADLLSTMDKAWSSV